MHSLRTEVKSACQPSQAKWNQLSTVSNLDIMKKWNYEHIPINQEIPWNLFCKAVVLDKKRARSKWKIPLSFASAQGFKVFTKMRHDV